MKAHSVHNTGRQTLSTGARSSVYGYGDNNERVVSFAKFSRYTSKSPQYFTPSSESDYGPMERKANDVTLGFGYIVTKQKGPTPTETLVSKDIKKS